MELIDRVQKAKNDKELFESLLNDYRPFIASSASRITGKFIDEHDDEMSIAIIAFSEAVERYQPELGNFIAFVNQVIRSRILDDIRRKKQLLQTTDLDEVEGWQSSKAGDQVKRGGFDDPVKLEMDSLNETLEAYGIDLMDLAERSPRHRSTKLNCAAVVRCILEHPAILDELKRSKQMPARSIEKCIAVPVKFIERNRKYIVCLVEILSGEYVYLTEYIRFVKEEQ